MGTRITCEDGDWIELDASDDEKLWLTVNDKHNAMCSAALLDIPTAHALVDAILGQTVATLRRRIKKN